MGEPIYRAEDIRVERAGQLLLDDISLVVSGGERLLIRGPSGAGKSTLFQVLGLLVPPTSGRLEIDGVDAAGLSERARARLRRDRIGIVFQESQLVPDLTARENAALPQEHRGERDSEWIHTLFGQLDISEFAEQYPATLSGGEKQRVAIARALANRPAVVLADEPTGQLDPESAERALDLLLDLHRSTDAALVVVSHDPLVAERFENSYELRDGRLS
jgi:putative ABC transport system ATP-binding protein